MFRHGVFTLAGARNGFLFCLKGNRKVYCLRPRLVLTEVL